MNGGHMQIKINSIDINYLQQGAGEDVLLLHGWGDSKTSFVPLLKHLCSNFRVTALDFPGHGESGEPPQSGFSVGDYADLLLAFMDALGINRAHIVAHSFGCRVTLKAASAHPTRFGKLLLTGAAGLRPKRGMKYYLRTYLYKTGKIFLSLLPGGKALVEKWRARFGSSDYQALKPALRATFIKVVNEDLHATLANIQSPTLLVFGSQDNATPLWMGKIMQSEIPAAALVVFEGRGHYAFAEEQPRFLRVMDAFLYS